MNGSRIISGYVNLLRRPTVDVALVDGNGQLWSIEAHLDTGFTGDLTLPSSAIEQLGLPFIAVTSFRTATGTMAKFNTYDGTIVWRGQERDIYVLESNVFPLVGVGLLWGNSLSVDFRFGGDVIIMELKDD